MKSLVRHLSALALLSITSIANAQLTFDSPGGTLVPSGTSGSAGYTFNVLSPFTIDALLVYTGGGFASPTVPIGLWNSTNTLIATTTVTLTTPEVTVDSAGGGNFLGNSIAPLTLATGTYTLAMYVSGVNDYALFGNTLITDARVSYGSYAGSISTSLELPPPIAVDLLFLGPSLRIQQTADVPEPGAVALFVGASFCSFVLKRRRK